MLARGTSIRAHCSPLPSRAKGKYREEKSGEERLYFFGETGCRRRQIENRQPKGSGLIRRLINFQRLNRRTRRCRLCDNTLAIGSIARVREALDAKTRVARRFGFGQPEPNALMSFGLKVPAVCAVCRYGQ